MNKGSVLDGLEKTNLGCHQDNVGCGAICKRDGNKNMSLLVESESASVCVLFATHTLPSKNFGCFFSPKFSPN